MISSRQISKAGPMSSPGSTWTWSATPSAIATVSSASGSSWAGCVGAGLRAQRPGVELAVPVEQGAQMRPQVGVAQDVRDELVEHLVAESSSQA